MFKAKLSFDTGRLEQNILEQLYDKVDEIFEPEGLNCVDGALVWVYEDKGREEDYGYLWVTIFVLEQTSELAENIKECIRHNGSARENLFTGSMGNQYMNSRQKKGINFDLDTNALKIYYMEGDWHNAHHDIRSLLRRWPNKKGSADTYIGPYEGRFVEAGSPGYLPC